MRGVDDKPRAGIEDIIPTDSRYLISRLGKGDPAEAKRWILAIAAFLAGQGSATSRAYAQGIKPFFDQFDWICPADVTIAHAIAFKKRLQSQGLSNATVQLRLAACASLFDFFCVPNDTQGEPLCKSNPFRYVPRRDIQVSPYARAKPVPWETFLKIYKAIPHDVHGLRDRAILVFYAFTGRRRSEVASLRIKDIDLTSRPRRYAVKVKGGKIQHYELPNVVYQALKAYWIASGRIANLSGDDHLFGHSDDPSLPLGSQGIVHVLQSAAERAGVDWRSEKIRLHGLRHMSARQLDKAGVTLREIQAFLGHMNPNTTAIYLDALSGTLPAHETTLSEIRKVADEFADLLGAD